MAASPEQFRGQGRLPRCAAPLRPDLRLRPDLAASAFSGAASAPTRFLVLNASELAVDLSSIRFQDLTPSEVVQFEEDEILVVGFDRELPIGEGVLKMDFTGTLNDPMRGFEVEVNHASEIDAIFDNISYDLASVIRMLQSYHGAERFQENWDHVLKTWPSSSLISYFVNSTVSKFTSEEKAAEISEFFAGRMKLSFERALKQSLERVVTRLPAG